MRYKEEKRRKEEERRGKANWKWSWGVEMKRNISIITLLRFIDYFLSIDTFVLQQPCSTWLHFISSFFTTQYNTTSQQIQKHTHKHSLTTRTHMHTYEYLPTLNMTSQVITHHTVTICASGKASPENPVKMVRSRFSALVYKVQYL